MLVSQSIRMGVFWTVCEYVCACTRGHVWACMFLRVFLLRSGRLRALAWVLGTGGFGLFRLFSACVQSF